MARLGQRWLRFNLVGTLGFLVQVAVLALLVQAGTHYLAATAAAVQAAVLHNFFWHEAWTWRDRRAADPIARLARLARFQALNGLVSLAGNLALTAALVSGLDLHPVAANVGAVLACSVLNFLAGEHVIFTRSGTAALAFVLILAPAGAGAAGPGPRTEAAWRAYEARVEARHEASGASGPFFLHDLAADTEWRQAVRRGDVAVRRLEDFPPTVPEGRVHHWAGAVFLPGLTLEALLGRLDAQAGRESSLYDDVMASRLVERRPDGVRIFLRLRREALLTMTYDTEHDVRYRRLGSRATGRSVATRIAEVADAGTARERILPPGEDRGFLWRLNAYWRYEQAPDGVVIECESLSLSRHVPAVARPVVGPLVDRLARESLDRTLRSLRNAMSGRPGR